MSEQEAPPLSGVDKNQVPTLSITSASASASTSTSVSSSTSTAAQLPAGSSPSWPSVEDTDKASTTSAVDTSKTMLPAPAQNTAFGATRTGGVTTTTTVSVGEHAYTLPIVKGYSTPTPTFATSAGGSARNQFAEEGRQPADKNSRLLRIESDDDDDIKYAKEMAMAIQENPNMTMDQIQQVLARRRDGNTDNTAIKQNHNPLNLPHIQNPFSKQSNLMADWNRLQGNVRKILSQNTGGTAAAKEVEVSSPKPTPTPAVVAADPGPLMPAVPPPAAAPPPPPPNMDMPILTPAKVAAAVTVPLDEKPAVSSPARSPARKMPNAMSPHPTPNKQEPNSPMISPIQSKSAHGTSTKSSSSFKKSIKSGMKSGVKSVKKTVSKTMHKSSKQQDKNLSPSPIDPTHSPTSPRRVHNLGYPPHGGSVDTDSLPGLPSTNTSTAADATDGGGGGGVGGGAINNTDMIRMSGTVWKRRSGFGKYSVSAAWERRRLVLRGNTLWYYKMAKDGKHSVIDDTAMTSRHMQLPDTTAAAAKNPGSASSSLLSAPSLFPTTSTSKSKGSWLEQTVNKASASLGMSVAVEEASNSRGHLDLVRDQASVGASFGHSGAPTPFALSLKLNGLTKWKLCFDTHAELMQWLATLTDVIVQGSIDSYNKELLLANDPSIDTTLTFPGQLSEPPAGGKRSITDEGDSSQGQSDSGGAPLAESGTPNEVSGHRLWFLGPYTIKNQEAVTQEKYSHATETDTRSDDDDDTSVSLEDSGDVDMVQRDSVSINQRSTTTSTSSRSADLNTANSAKNFKPRWAIHDASVLYAGLTINLAMILGRSSALSPSLFWYVLLFANLILASYFNRELPVVVKASSLASSTTKTSTVIQSRGNNVRVSRKKRIDANKTLTVGVASGQAASIGPALSTDTENTVDEADFKPIAGTSAMQIKEPKDEAVDKDGNIFAGWRSVPSSGIEIRSQGYASNGKKKVPSPGELYELMYCDIFESPHRCPDMSSRVQLPTISFDDDAGDTKTWNSPDIFVISIALPTDPPKMTRGSNDGGGFTITMYFSMKQETRDILRRVTAEGYDPSQEPKPDDPQKSIVNAAKLFDEWCRRAPTDDKFMARFKCVPNAQNLKEIGLPSWISSYNGKPFLIKRPGQTGFLYRHPEYSCMEFDISLHPFPYLAKQGICYMKDSYFSKVLVTFGFTIEGRADDELPEAVIGLMQLCYPDPTHAIQADDFFSGKSPKSFEGKPAIINGNRLVPPQPC